MYSVGIWNKCRNVLPTPITPRYFVTLRWSKIPAIFVFAA
ncbi:hypothetical protein MVUOKPPV_CDS0099 [Klebsiella phage phi1_175008]|uniref:Uncharacterized protein n=1 Tax=Klebsiella phage phi1_175008 TaxID=3127744 RepID=A0ACD5FRG8_9CAUD